MASVVEAEKIVLSHLYEAKSESIDTLSSLSRTLALDILADRDSPPFDRATMDGIAIKYSDFSAGHNKFKIHTLQPAGAPAVATLPRYNCLEIMTGAAVPTSVDTIIPIEQITVSGGYATINTDSVKAGQFVHKQASDGKTGDVLVGRGQLITPSIVQIALSVGLTNIDVAQSPNILIISTGDELVEPSIKPESYQIRKTNDATISSILQPYSADFAHLPDNKSQIINSLSEYLEKYDTIIISGGVSKGKLDFIPDALASLGVKKLFHGVSQKPGGPFWFGQIIKPHHTATIFALPGNPVSSFMCTHRYVIPWLEKSLSQTTTPPTFAKLAKVITFSADKTYFAQVNVSSDSSGQLLAEPCEGNNSGDFINLSKTNAFMELPANKNVFEQGESYRIWPYRGVSAL